VYNKYCSTQHTTVHNNYTELYTTHTIVYTLHTHYTTCTLHTHTHYTTCTVLYTTILHKHTHTTHTHYTTLHTHTHTLHNTHTLHHIHTHYTTHTHKHIACFGGGNWPSQYFLCRVISPEQSKVITDKRASDRRGIPRNFPRIQITHTTLVDSELHHTNYEHPTPIFEHPSQWRPSNIVGVCLTVKSFQIETA